MTELTESQLAKQRTAESQLIEWTDSPTQTQDETQILAQIQTQAQAQAQAQTQTQTPVQTQNQAQAKTKNQTQAQIRGVGISVGIRRAGILRVRPFDKLGFCELGFGNFSHIFLWRLPFTFYLCLFLPLHINLLGSSE